MLAGENSLITNILGFFSNNRWPSIKGKVLITNYRLIFLPDDFTFLDKGSLRKDYFHYPMTFMDEIQYINKKELDFPVEFKFIMKDSTSFSLKIQPKPDFDYQKTFDYINSRSKIEDFRSFFAFAHHDECKKIHKGFDIHWSFNDIKNEMKRQGILDKIVIGSSEKTISYWRLVDNSDYRNN